MKKNLLILLLSATAVLAQTPPAQPGSPPPAGGAPAAKPKIVVNSPAWNLKVQEAAKNPLTIKDALAEMPPEQYADFAAALIKAIETLPTDPDLVIADRVALAAKELIGATPGSGRTEMVSTIFAVTEIAYLPAVAEALVPSFSKSVNNMGDAAYETVSKTILGAIAEKTATTDNGTARLSIAVSIFEAGGGLNLAQTQALVASACPNIPEATRETVTTVANQIASTGSYEGVANLTGATLSITPTTQQQITQRLQTPAQGPTPTANQPTPATTTPGEPNTPPSEQGTPAEGNTTGAPGLTPAVNTPGSTTEGLLGAIGNRGTDPIGTVIGSNTGAASAPGQGGDNQGGAATGGGDVAPPPPPPPPPPTPYQGQGR